jgi:hypothetical protein
LDDDPFDEPAAVADVGRDAAVRRDDLREPDDRVEPAARLGPAPERLLRAGALDVLPAPRPEVVAALREPPAPELVAALREAPPPLLAFFAAVLRPVCFRGLLDVATRSPFPG